MKFKDNFSIRILCFAVNKPRSVAFIVLFYRMKFARSSSFLTMPLTFFVSIRFLFVAEQQQYMKQHDALPPAPLGHQASGRRHLHRISHTDKADFEHGGTSSLVGGLTQSELERLEATERNVTGVGEQGRALSRIEQLVQPPTLVTFSST